MAGLAMLLLTTLAGRQMVVPERVPSTIGGPNPHLFVYLPLATSSEFLFLAMNDYKLKDSQRPSNSLAANRTSDPTTPIKLRSPDASNKSKRLATAPGT